MLPLRSISRSSFLRQCLVSVSRSAEYQLQKPISTTSARLVKEVRIHEDDQQITVEGVHIKSDRTEYVIQHHLLDENKAKLADKTAAETATEATATTEMAPLCACPLCRLNLKNLQYHDVLILNQFVHSDGSLIPRSQMPLCARSYARVKRLVEQAWKARLLPRPATFTSYGPWDELNRYYEWPKRRRDRPADVVREEYWEGSRK